MTGGEWVGGRRSAPFYAKRGETATDVIIARDAESSLRYAVRANPRRTLWTWDDELSVRRVEGATG